MTDHAREHLYRRIYGWEMVRERERGGGVGRGGKKEEGGEQNTGWRRGWIAAVRKGGSAS